MTTQRPKRLGNFEILARIARGGMAEIFLARQAGISRLVVVKRILPHLAEEEQFVAMLHQEAGLAAHVNHPNVVHILEVGRQGDESYIAMEFIDGPSVATMLRLSLRRGGPVPAVVASEIVAQACDGLHAAHEQDNARGEALGLVHRDISPQNLMVSSAGMVKLVDFGIAKARSSSVRTHTGNIKGKYPYMSPEQCQGDPLDRRTDLFSLGIVFFEMVVGKRLFKRGTDLMTLKAITEEPVPEPLEMREGIPAELNAVILRALNRDREHRYATADEMGNAVRGVMSEMGVTSSPKLLAGYLESECGELLEARRGAIRTLSESADSIPSVLRLDEDADGSSGYGSLIPTAAAGPAARRKLAEQEEEEPLKDKPAITSRPVVIALSVILLAALVGLVFRLTGDGEDRSSSVASGPTADARVEPDHPAGPPFIMGFPRSYNASVWAEEMRPFADYLEKGLSRRVELVVPQSYKALRADLLDGRIQLGYLPPLQYVLAREQNPKLRILVTPSYEGATTYQGFIITRNDSKITSLTQLKGRRFCYVDPGSASGYLYPRHHLRINKLDPDAIFSETFFSGDHIAVMQDIIKGRCDAGAVYSGAFSSASAHKVAVSKLPMVAITGQLPYDAVCSSPNLNEAQVEVLLRLLLAFDTQKHLGRRLLGPTIRISGFVKTPPATYDLVEQSARSEGAIK